MKKHYNAIGILTILVVLLLWGGFGITGSPLESRQREIDQKRVDHIMSIKYSIENYYSKNKRLPTSLNNLSQRDSLNDPETGELYTYRTYTAHMYELCATFSTDQSVLNAQESGEYEYNGKPYPGDMIRRHGKGTACERFTIPDYLSKPQRTYQNTYVEPVVGAFSSMSATLDKTAARFEFEYSGVSSRYTVEMSTVADFSENVYRTFATGSKSPLKAINPPYFDYFCGQTVYWRVLAEPEVYSDSVEGVVCGGPEAVEIDMVEVDSIQTF